MRVDRPEYNGSEASLNLEFTFPAHQNSIILYLRFIIGEVAYEWWVHIR